MMPRAPYMWNKEEIKLNLHDIQLMLKGIQEKLIRSDPRYIVFIIE